MDKVDVWKERVILWIIVGLWLTGSFFLLGGFCRLVYLNSHVRLAIGQVLDNGVDPNGNAWINITSGENRDMMTSIIVIGHFADQLSGRQYLESSWPVGSSHACLILPDRTLSISIYLEYWSLIVAGTLLLIDSVLVIVIVSHQCYLRYRRLQYQELNSSAGKDFVLISAKDLDEQFRADGIPVTSGRSAMDSFEEAQSLLWKYKYKIIAQLGLEIFDQCRQWQVQAIMENDARRFQFQHDIEAILVRLV